MRISVATDMYIIIFVICFITDSEVRQMELEIGVLVSCHINTAWMGVVDLIHFLFCLTSLFD